MTAAGFETARLSAVKGSLYSSFHFWTPAVAVIGRGVMSASVKPSAHLIASKYIRYTSGLSQVFASCPRDE
jgi:hypothetical protein